MSVPAGGTSFASKSLGTILLAEDNEDDAFFVRRALAQTLLPVKLIHVPDGDHCLQYIKGEHPYDDRNTFPFPALLLLDLKMPRVGGVAVLDWVRSQPDLATLPVV